jgi:arginyl-tRNA synthetase
MSIAEKLKKYITQALAAIGAEGVSFTLEHPTELSHGDYATNAAMVCAKTLGKNPREIAAMIVSKLEEQQVSEIGSLSIAGPGFINITLNSSYFSETIPSIIANPESVGKNSLLAGKRVMIEYTQPNPFKPFHIGHLMSNAIGESLSRIVEFSGADLVRANYQGDVGRHVAMAIYALMKKGKPDTSLSIAQQATAIGVLYSWAAGEYEANPEARQEIDTINKQVYERSNPTVNELYDWGRALTLDAFEEIYRMLGTSFQYYFFESEAATICVPLVREFLEKGVFEESDGAVVFKGEKYDSKLHTRVFLTSAGLPTYDAKEIGLAKMKFDKEPNLDLSITTTAIEQLGVIGVAYEAIYQIWPELRRKLKHVTHGMMRLASGKMSSRKGNIVTGESLIADSRAMALEKMQEREGIPAESLSVLATQIGVGALKYSILKSSPGSDVVYDFEKSISFDGDSGPYLQYTHARIASMLAKAEDAGIPIVYHAGDQVTNLERVLVRLSEVVEQAYVEYSPNYLATYLIDLAREFNSFYGANKIIDTENREVSAHRLAIARATQIVLKNGLWLLGITAPDRM